MMTRTATFIISLLIFAGTQATFAQESRSYDIRNGRVYYENMEVRGVDHHSFRDLGYGYAKDRYHVYMHGRVLPYVDPSYFKVSSRFEAEDEHPWNDGYGGIFMPDPPYPPARTGTRPRLKYPHHHGYKVVGSEVLFDGRIVRDAMASSFQDLGQGYAKDPFNVYFFGEKISDASPSNFEILKDGYSKDSFNAYYLGRKIEGAGLNFRVLDDGYAEDGFRIWYRGRLVEK